MTKSETKTGIRVVLWHGTSREEHTVSDYAAAMDMVDERHSNAAHPRFYDAETGDELNAIGDGFFNHRTGVRT